MAVGIAILFIVTSIIPCIGQRIDKIGDIKNADFGNINDVIQTNKGKIHNTPFLRFLDSHSHMFPLLKHLLEL